MLKIRIIYCEKSDMHSWGQKGIRFYDPDGTPIKAGIPV